MALLDTATPRAIDEDMISSTVAATDRPAHPNGLSASMTHAWRALLKLKHTPLQLADVIIFPILMTVMFTYIFGGALAGSTSEYIQGLIPGILLMNVTFVSMYTAVGLNTDISKGIFDRFRSLPFWRPSVLIGALLGDMVRYSIGGLVVVTFGVILGFRPEAGIMGVIASFGILLLFGFSLSWIWTALGLVVDDAESVTMISQTAMFPLTFISNVFVDPATMPSFLQNLVEINPISLTVTAIRGLMHGTATAEQIGYVLISCAVMIIIFAPLTMYLYTTKNTR